MKTQSTFLSYIKKQKDHWKEALETSANKASYFNAAKGRKTSVIKRIKPAIKSNHFRQNRNGL